VHLTPKFFFSLKRIHLLFEAFGRRNLWIWLNPRFSMPFQSRAWSVTRPRFSESGAAVADDVYPGTKHNGASVSSLYLLEKMENKTNRSNLFGTKSSKFCFRIISFSSLESELGFDSEDTEINFDRARSTTENPLLRALRTICNISSATGKTSLRTSCLHIRNGKLDAKWRSRQTKSRKEKSRTALDGYFVT